MGAVVVRVDGLPGAPLDAASAFFREHLGLARAALADGRDVALLFPPASHAHRTWRLGAVQELAREAAPLRVNGVVGDNAAAIDQALAYLAAAPGVTGQLLAVDGKSGEKG